MGEGVFEQKALVKAVDSAWQEQQQERAAEVLRVATPGGRFHVRWDEGGSATALGQLVFFAEFLDVSGLFARWVDGCPMADTSPNAPAVGNVLGTWLLSILDGQRRYAHVTGPSHTLHTYWIGNLRLVLDVEVPGGKASAAKHRLPRRCQLLERLAPEERPTRVRGDNAFGKEGVMREMAAMGQRYLFKLRQTAGVNRLIERQWQHGEWHGVGQGEAATHAT